MSPKPPRAAARLVELFVSMQSADAVLGDLEEEFAERLSRSGHGAARQWYWRHALRTTIHLVWGSVRTAPWSTAALMCGSLLAARLADLAIRATVDVMLTNVNAYDYVSAAWFWRIADAIRYLAVPLALGWSTAAVARGRGMTIVTLVAAALVAGFAWNVTVIAQRGVSLGVLGHSPLAYHLVQMGTTFPLCVFAGGMMARVQQMHAAGIAQ